ncbi:MAG TPA: ABC transporter permease [Chloroflexota bacterium]|nr:ABC transporter permease [Chloroflexota bacterium]
MAVSERSVSVGPGVAAVAFQRQAPSPWTAARRRFVRSRTGLLGAVVLLVITFAAVFAPLVAPYNPTRQDFRVELQPPSREHVMGTDEFGRDVFSRVIWGGRASLAAGSVAASIALAIGLLLGMLAAFYGGRPDNIIMRVMDIILAFPYLLLAIAVVAILGPGLLNAMIAIGIVYIPHYARVVRGAVLAVRAREYVEAARALGAGDRRIMGQHVLPNTLAPVIVQTTLTVGVAIIDTAGLSFLGLGTQPPTPDWGNMLSGGRSYVIDSPWIATFPGLAILVTVLSFNLMGDALRDAFDPRLR